MDIILTVAIAPGKYVSAAAAGLRLVYEASTARQGRAETFGRAGAQSIKAAHGRRI